MKELIDFLPSEINTALLIFIIIGVYKGIAFVKVKVKQRNIEKKAFEKEVLEKERKRSKFESRLKKVEEQVISIKQDFREKNAENKEEFIILTKKIDKILEILIQPIIK